jgi:inositol phosphorylceramide mannosyltransferase catalytic subunit
MTNRIPKIIHQTWKTDEIPDEWKPSSTAWQQLFPDHKYILWTDEMNRKLVKTHFPELLELYDGFQYNIQRADMIRYCILKTYGGIYSDLDMKPLSRDLEKYWNTGDEIYLVETPNSGNLYSSVSNFFMASIPGCQFWDIVLKQIQKPVPWYAIGKHLKVHFSTGPFVIQLSKLQYNGTIGLLPRNLFAPCSIEDFDPEKGSCNINGKKSALIQPLKGMSWVSWDTRFYNVLIRNRFLIGIILLLLFVWMIQQLISCKYYKKICRIKK